MIYFDKAATTMPNKEVLDVYQKVAKTIWHNPSGMYLRLVQQKQIIPQFLVFVISTLE